MGVRNCSTFLDRLFSKSSISCTVSSVTTSTRSHLGRYCWTRPFVYPINFKNWGFYLRESSRGSTNLTRSLLDLFRNSSAAIKTEKGPCILKQPGQLSRVFRKHILMPPVSWVFDLRESSRGLTILTCSILVILGRLRSSNPGALTWSKSPTYRWHEYM